jgi:hypothetical protein
VGEFSWKQYNKLYDYFVHDQGRATSTAMEIAVPLFLNHHALLAILWGSNQKLLPVSTKFSVLSLSIPQNNEILKMGRSSTAEQPPTQGGQVINCRTATYSGWAGHQLQNSHLLRVGRSSTAEQPPTQGRQFINCRIATYSGLILSL